MLHRLHDVTNRNGYVIAVVLHTMTTLLGYSYWRNHMSRLEQFETLLTDLQSATAKDRFTLLFQRGVIMLELDDDNAASIFDTSRPNANRWRRGKVVPPAAKLVLRILAEQVHLRIRTLKRLEVTRRELANRSEVFADVE